MPNKPILIILDTNLLISFLITKDYSKLDKLIFSRRCIILFSNKLLEELIEVAKRPKFRRFFPSSAIEELLELLNEYADFVNTTTKVEACRDTKDNFCFH